VEFECGRLFADGQQVQVIDRAALRHCDTHFREYVCMSVYVSRLLIVPAAFDRPVFIIIIILAIHTTLRG
jgi:hypothetical protein